ncbi:MAG TPA: PAS domain S-box protein [Pontiella sp.]
MVCAVAAASAAFASAYIRGFQDQPALSLTQEEKAWLDEHRNSIRLAPLPDTRPVDFFNAAGRHEGLTADYIRLIEKMLGVEFQRIRCENWEDVLLKAENREVDMLSSVQNRTERQAFLDFTSPYQPIEMVIVVRGTESRILNRDNMESLQIALVNKSAAYDYLDTLHPDYSLIAVDDADAGFRKLLYHDVDAFVTDHAAASQYFDKLNTPAALRIAGNINYPWDLCLASRSDWPMLNSILEKALEAIPKSERVAIKEKWINVRYIDFGQYLIILGAGLVALCFIAAGAVTILRKQLAKHKHELGRVRKSHEQTAAALGVSEERFRLLVESTNDMIWETDRYGTYVYVSPSAYGLLGYTPEELVGKSSLSLMSKEDSARKMEALRKYSLDTVLDCEVITYVRKDGRKIILESSGTAYSNNRGAFAGLRGVSRDVTDRIESETALRFSEERFRNLVETTSDWIWEVDIDGTYTYSSPQVADLLGYSAEELLGEHFTDSVAASNVEAVRDRFNKRLGQGLQIHSLITTNHHKSGRAVMLETSAVPFYDKSWIIQGYRGISRDITDRIEAEKKLQFERGLFRSFMRHAPDLIYFKDKQGRFIDVNDAKAQELQTSPEELIGRSDFDFLPEEQARQMFNDELEVMRTRAPLQKEEYAETPSGEQWYLTTKVPHYNENGEIIGTFGTSWNITSRKKAEEQLRQLRALLSNTIDSMPSILISVDADGRVIQWNRKAEPLAGRPLADAVDLPLDEVFPSLSKEMDKVKRAIAERQVQTEERIAVKEDGRTRYTDITVYPLLEGETEGAVIRIDDVTDRVLIEDSIRNIVEGVSSVGHRFFSSMVNQLAKTLDADYTFIAEFADGNRELMHTIAVSDNGKNETNFEFLLTDSPFDPLLNGNDVCNHIRHAQGSNGSRIEALQHLQIDSCIGVPLTDSENKPLGIMVAIYSQPVDQIDFATSIMRVFAGRTAAELERLQATKDLLALRNLLENIINAMPSMLIGVDATGRIMQWNQEAAGVTGIDSSQAFGQPLRDVLPDFGPEMNRVLTEIQENGHHHERINCSINGQMRMIDVTAYPVTTGEQNGAVIRLDDVTDRVRIDEMMVQTEKMLSVGGLAAGMAHEINNPLAGILQNLQVMRNRITHETDRNMNAALEAGTTLGAIQAYMDERGLIKMMDSISEAARRAAKIVDNMLSFSRKDEAYFALNDLAEIIERSLELASNDYNLKKRFDFRHIRIVREFDELGPVPCESSQIQQVILNLLSNSAQAMADRPDSQAEPCIILRLKAETDMARIEIEDNGPGMDAETRKRAFEPFFTTKDVGHGTGLGLSVSYFIITENHGGTMTLASEPGKGAKFSIGIPYERRMERVGLRL